MQNGEDCVTLNGRLIQLTPTNTPNYQIHSSNKSITDQIIQLHLILASASAPSPIYLCSTCVFAVHVSLQYMCLCSTCVFAVEVSLLTEFWTRGYGTDSSNKSITDQIIQLHQILASASAPSPYRVSKGVARLYIHKRALQIHKRALKEPYISENEPYISAKEPCISKEP